MPIPHRPLLTHVAATAVAASLLSACDSDSNNQSPPQQKFEKQQAEVTWHQHIAPLVAEKCGTCHTRSGVAPFSVETYDQVEAWASTMEHRILNNKMPPWGAQDTDECNPPRAFEGDLRLSDAEKALFSEWVTAGAPEGDISRAAPLPEVTQDVLDNPNRQITMPAPLTIEGDHDRFVCFRMEVGNETEVWVTASQLVPGNRAIAHHALVFSDPNNVSAALVGDDGSYDCSGGPGLSATSLVNLWAPGMGPNRLPKDTGALLEANAVLVVQMHYHPTGAGAEVDDATRLDLQWSTEQPAYVGKTFLLGNSEQEDDPDRGGEGFGLVTGPDFKIPAGAERHVEINKIRFPPTGDPEIDDLPMSIWMVGTHMHYAGKDMKVTLNESQPNEQCLVQTPDWDFDWQRLYHYQGDIATLPTMSLGDTFTLRCTYNNSLSNPAIAHALKQKGLEAPQDLILGDETLEEMCIAMLGLAVPAENAALFGQ